MISPPSRAVIGLDYVLSQLKPASPYGQALKSRTSPYKAEQEEKLKVELDLIEQVLALLSDDNYAKHLHKVSHYLGQLPDWHESLNRAVAGGVLSEVELFNLKQTLFYISAIQATLAAIDPNPFIKVNIDNFSTLESLLDPENSLSPSFYLSDSFSPKLGEIRAKIREIRRHWNNLSASLREQAAKTTGLPFNLAGEITISRSDRPFRLKVEKSGIFIISRETYTDVYYQLKQTNQELAWISDIERLSKSEDEEEERIRTKLSVAVKQNGEALYNTFSGLSIIDLVISKAQLAHLWQAKKPHIVGQSEPLSITFQGARHPKVEEELAVLGK
ncbi:MAG: hypothetical protein Q8N36_02725, partial [bacterium]|nr:hypothetical protein [bacterium]